jgi:hypothetical protein
MNTHAPSPMKPASAPARTFVQERPLTPALFGTLQRTCACGGGGGSCPECEKKNKKLQRWSTKQTAEGATAPAIVHEVLGSEGQTLEPSTRSFMEPRFGHDFSRVRIHSDSRAAESARAVNALAYTVGDHLVFDHSHYAPGTHEGRRLLAHELTHTIQQSRASSPDARFDALTVGAADDVHEREADAYAESVSAARTGQPQQGPPSKLVSRLQDGNAGETRCDVSVGTPSSAINSPSPCYEPCTRRHEAVHVRDLSPCCTKANQAYKAATTDDKKQAVQDKMNQWVLDNVNYLECNGYTESVRCADEFLTANCSAPKPQSSTESPATENQQDQMAATDTGGGTPGTEPDSERNLVSERLPGSALRDDKPADAPIDPQRCCATVKDYRTHHRFRRDALCAAKKNLTPCLF